MTNDNFVVRTLQITFPEPTGEDTTLVHMVATDAGDMYPFREGDSLALRATPDHDLVGIFELRPKEMEYRTTIYRPESIRGWIREFWQWYRS